VTARLRGAADFLNMRKLLFIALFFAVIGSSCSKDEEAFVLKLDYTEAQKSQLVKDEKVIEDFIAEKQIKDVQRTANGLYYVVIDPGKGGFKYTEASQILAKYTGRLLNGQVFDSSDKSSPAGVAFPLTRVITGWQDGIPLIQKGGKIRLLIPSVMGYGSTGQGTIPANAVLDFDVEIVDLR